MTASVLPEHRRASVDAGMDGFASKPVDWYALSHEIARVLGLGAGQQLADLPAQERQLLNRHAGVHRWGGTEDAYQEALAHFGRQHGGVGRALAAHAATGEYRALRMLPTRSAASPANLGMELLADALARLEGLVDGDSGRPYPGAEQTLRDTVTQSIAMLDEALWRGDRGPARGGPPDPGCRCGSGAGGRPGPRAACRPRPARGAAPWRAGRCRAGPASRANWPTIRWRGAWRRCMLPYPISISTWPCKA